jgi:hypothetical protein
MVEDELIELIYVDVAWREECTFNRSEGLREYFRWEEEKPNVVEGVNAFYDTKGRKKIVVVFTDIINESCVIRVCLSAVWIPEGMDGEG